uniref:Uncharacterized protein n=1 Tax=Sphaerodactylus townsendi TaxID=933632 RepID=A0ACB8FNW0_9SAUR
MQMLVTEKVIFLISINRTIITNDINYATVYLVKAEKKFYIKDVMDRNGDAYGYYNNTVQSTGWGILEIKAGYGSQSISNEDLMYAAGFLEGYLTASHISDHVANLSPQLFKNVIIMKKVEDFMGKQDQWTREQIRNNPDDQFWRHTGYIIAQMDGLYMGTLEWAKQQKRPPLTVFETRFPSAAGDLLDLIPSFLSHSTEENYDFLSGGRIKYRWDMGHCSALIKVLPGYENIYFAHSSWFTYAATLRIYKHWDFKIDSPETSSGRVSFSSYPGDEIRSTFVSFARMMGLIQDCLGVADNKERKWLTDEVHIKSASWVNHRSLTVHISKMKGI